MAIEPTRFQLLWASAAGGKRFAREIGRIVEEVRALGSLGWGRPPIPESPLVEPAAAPAGSTKNAGHAGLAEEAASVPAEVPA
jgi:hypothetical protein